MGKTCKQTLCGVLAICLRLRREICLGLSLGATGEEIFKATRIPRMQLHVTISTVIRLAQATVTSCLDDCNSLPRGFPVILWAQRVSGT